MDELLRRLTASGFAELEGLQVTGTLPVRQDIVNDVLTGLLKDKQASGSAPATEVQLAGATVGSASTEPAKSQPNWWKLVHKLQVKFTEGKLVVDFELRR